MTRRLLIAGNWKMHTDLEGARSLAAGVAAAAAHPSVDVLVAPPGCLLQAVIESVGSRPVAVAAQNLHPAPQGAFTGEQSTGMLRSLGASHAICGHSERRHVFGESDDFIGLKVKACHAAALTPILCVGETLAERESGQTEAVVARQLDMGLGALDAAQVATTVIAYEPVWAIGTGRTASPEQAQAVHAFIRQRLAGAYGEAVSQAVVIQYGGSVNAGNASDLLGCLDIDGALVGGASLAVASFSAIIEAGAAVS